jgi:hypothetical protein
MCTFDKCARSQPNLNSKFEIKKIEKKGKENKKKRRKKTLPGLE